MAFDPERLKRELRAILDDPTVSDPLPTATSELSERDAAIIKEMRANQADASATSPDAINPDFDPLGR
jgi:hypothetical protein